VLPVTKNPAQLSPPLIPGTDNLSQRDSGTGQLGTHGPAQKPLSVEDAQLSQIARIKAQCHRGTVKLT